MNQRRLQRAGGTAAFDPCVPLPSAQPRGILPPAAAPPSGPLPLCPIAEEDAVELAQQLSPRLVRALSLQSSPAEPPRQAELA